MPLITEIQIALVIGLPLLVIGGIWAIVRDITRNSRVASETKNTINIGLDDLRQEVIRLRDTSTQYDMSIEANLSELRQRMAYMESRMPIEPSTVTGSAPLPAPTYVLPNATDETAEQTISVGRSID